MPPTNNPFRMLHLAFKQLRLRRKWRDSAKRRRCIAVRVANVIEFLDDLERHGIKACVLRWPDAVPVGKLSGLDKKQTDEIHGDVDLLVSIRRLDELLPVAARHTCESGVKCEIYSVTGIKGTQFKGFAYYPQLRAMRLLANRRRHPQGFWCLGGRDYILSLVYHLLYHKGLASGIPADGASGTAAGDKYSQRLRAEAAKEGVALPAAITLESLESWLCAHDWQMPFDLLLRWPVRDRWIELLEERKVRELSVSAPAQYQFVYVLRDDIENTPLEKTAEAMLAREFEIVESAVIPPAAREEVAMRLRGGNWGEGKDRKLIVPCKFITCVDHHPAPPAQVNKLYPHVDNAHFYSKHEIRKVLCAEAGRTIYGIHGSDNVAEALYMKSIWRQFIHEPKHPGPV